MKFPFYIARRYLLSKKSTHAINIISMVSVIGVAVATTAMVVVMSGFNGFSDLVATLFTSFDPQLKITSVKGKTIASDNPAIMKVKQLPEVEVATECVEEQALAIYHGKQAMVTVKGVDDSFEELTSIGGILYGDGSYQLHAANLQYGIIGIRLAQQLGTGARWDDYLYIYTPNRDGQPDIANPVTAFVTDSLLSPGVVFQVRQAKYDKSYIITSISFARSLFNRQGEMTSLELRLKAGANIEDVKEEIKSILGSSYKIMDRYEQQADTFSIMQIEKLFAYAFLTFILLVACINIIGSVAMLMIDKKNDIATLTALGASREQTAGIFLMEARLISAIGAIAGIAIGLLLCYLQQTYGIVRLGNSEGSFIINAYPISVHPSDILRVFVTVIITGWIAAYLPVKHICRNIMGNTD